MAAHTLFEDARLAFDDSLRLTVESLRVYGPAHRHWCIAYSGGKDSTSLVTVIAHLLATGQVEPPETLTVLYADTRMELVPLSFAAQQVIAQLRARGVRVEVVMAPMDKRFLVYMLGRGVPPPNNGTFRWCTRQIKVDPMHDAVEEMVAATGEPMLMLTGVRIGESAVRDQRIALSCSRDGAECGQGWYQHAMPADLCATLAPLLHWRVCHVFDWLTVFAPSAEFGGWDTSIVAEVYGGDEAEEMNARTGCMGCPLVDHDTSLDGLLRLYPESWGHLAPLKKLRPLWRELRRPMHRLRQPGGERRKDGTLVSNQNRMGAMPVTSREWALEVVLSIQAEVNAGAAAAGRPGVDMLNAEEEARIRELQAARQFPHGWTGDEPLATEFFTEAGDLFEAAASDG